MHMLPFWCSHEKACVLLAGDSPQGRGKCSSSSLPCAAPLASWSWGEPWLQGSSSLTHAQPLTHPPCLCWTDSYYPCLRYLKKESSNPIFKLNFWHEGFLGTWALKPLVCSSPCPSGLFSVYSLFLFRRYCSEEVIFFAKQTIQI